MEFTATDLKALLHHVRARDPAPSLFPLRFRRVTLSAGLRPALAGAGATPKPQKRNAVLEAFPDVSVISNPVRQLMGKPPETTHFSYWQ